VAGTSVLSAALAASTALLLTAVKLGSRLDIFLVERS